MVKWSGFAISANKRLIPTGIPVKMPDGKLGFKPGFRINPRYRAVQKKIRRSCVNHRLIEGYVDLKLRFNLYKECDTDNYLKLVCDSIKNKLISDDRWIRNIEIERIHRNNQKELDEIIITVIKAPKEYQPV